MKEDKNLISVYSFHEHKEYFFKNEVNEKKHKKINFILLFIIFSLN